VAPERAPGGGLPEDRARGVEICLSRGGRSLKLLRRQVEGRAAGLAESRGSSFAVDLHGGAEVGQHDLAGGPQEEIRGFEIAVDDPLPV